VAIYFWPVGVVSAQPALARAATAHRPNWIVRMRVPPVFRRSALLAMVRLATSNAAQPRYSLLREPVRAGEIALTSEDSSVLGAIET